jgi:small-conductance mechanosensitive channel
VVIALAAIELTQLGVTRIFTRLAHRARTPRRAAQVRTLAPLFSGVATTVFIIIAAMMALSEIGVEIGPLIAGAGIVGLAVGFGAQTLVKDFLTGIFLIIEDTVSIGDIARIGDSSGLVEDMSLRILEPIEIFGVDQLADSGVVLKARIKTQPIKQWTVGREYLQRIKLAFDAAGIEIPFPHLKLVPPDQPIPVGEADVRRAAE